MYPDIVLQTSVNNNQIKLINFLQLKQQFQKLTNWVLNILFNVNLKK